MIKDNAIHYGSITKIIHWLMAFLIILIFIIGYTMTNISPSSTRLALYDFHKATGLVVLSLFFIRLLWRTINTYPSLTTSLSKRIKFIAKYNRTVLYLLMLGLPISGFLISVLGGYRVSIYYLFTIQPFTTNKNISHLFSTIHQLLVYLLAFAFFLHVMGALYHHLILKDNVLKNMWMNKQDGGSSVC